MTIVKTPIKIVCLTAFALILCGLFSACQETQVTNPNYEAITGKFLNQNGIPVEGVTVEVTDATGKVVSTDVTDANGFFRIQNLPTVLTNGIVSFVSEGEIIHQETLEKVVNLSANGKVGDIFQDGENDFEAVFQLTIKDAETQLPIPDADVRLATSQNSAFNRITDVQGIVAFDGIAPGRYHLRVTKTDYITYEDAFVLLFPEGMDTLRHTIYLAKGNADDTTSNPNPFCCTNSVRFYVFDAETQQKITNAVAVAIAINGKLTKGSTNNNGLIEFDELCEDHYAVTVDADGYDSYTFRMTVECDDDKELQPVYLTKKPELCCDNSVTVFVIDSIPNTIIPNATVRLIQNNSIVKELNTGSWGQQITFGNVCEGNYQVSILTPAGNKQIPIKVECNDYGLDSMLVQAYFHLTPEEDCEGSIKLTVKFESDSLSPNTPPLNGAPISGATVKLTNINTKQEFELTTNANGVVQFNNLPRGEYLAEITYSDANGVIQKTSKRITLKCNGWENYEGTVEVRKE